MTQTTTTTVTTVTTAPASTDRAELAAAVKEVAGLVQEWVDLRRRMLRVPGVQVAVRVDGELLISGASGSADLAEGVDLTPRHLFRIASHSKTFAATAVMMLAARGALRLDDTVGTHLPELADTPLADRTVRELIGHQGGVIRDGDDCDYWQLTRDFPDSDTLFADLHRDGATFGRNEHFKYSNYGYSIVGAIIERVGGQDFAGFVRSEILDVLELPRVHPDVDGVPADELASGHSLLLDGDDEMFVLRNPSTGAMAAATGFVACAEDLTAYAGAHVKGDERLLSDTDKRLMQRTESVVMAGTTELGRYGLGLELHTVGTRALVGHSGGFPGFVTRTFVDPQASLVVSVLTNASRGPAHPIALGVIKLIDLALAKRALPPPAAPEDATDPVDLDSFVTTMVGGFGRVVIARMGERLVLLHPEQDDPTEEVVELTVLGPDRLLMPARPGFGSAGEPVIFTREGGRITEIRMGGMTAWPEADFRARRRAQMGRSATTGAGTGPAS
ncbi:beta-lactamase family protein [Nakamurella flavida]|uniref:Beta-lactamase family protein n=1 Tax=Nakamurella flavida TaxID=363630 RepID=A0A938YQQ3_9ACTN|nr:serine hydrolase domain-containing protein [Nakamurella flavida]MBM9477702.1 beta-lactamase family protein [Nakamurella flavida]MDP9779254.1 CubicO group peptidase (beta-lactamase class C family) [Nakamurella flavida]